MKKKKKLKYLGIALSLGIVSITALTMNNKNINNILIQETEIPKVAESSFTEEVSWNISAVSNSNVIATLYTNGLLEISGTGDMKNWESTSQVDWVNKKDSIKTIVIDEGITGIGNWAFSGFTNSENEEKTITVVIPKTVKNLGSDIFTNSTNLKIYCAKYSVVEYYVQGTQLTYVTDGEGPVVNSIIYLGSELNQTFAPDYEMRWETTDVTAEIMAGDQTEELGSDIAPIKYSFDGGITWQEENTRKYTDYSPGVKIVVKDILGNTTEVSVDILIDKIQPTINNVVVQPEGWTGSETIVTVDAVDAQSGIGQYSFDGGVTWQSENLKGYTENTNGIEIKVRDLMGHVATYQTINVTNIDKEGPVINEIQKSTTDLTKDGVTLTVNATDSSSGISGQAYSFDNGLTWQESNAKTYTKNVDGIIIKVKDNIGNVTTSDAVSITNIDKSAPTITSVTGNSTGWTNKDVTLTVNASDNLSGLNAKAYSFDNGVTWQSENTKTFTQIEKVTIQVRDNLENIATTVINVWIDKSAPTITSVTGNPTEWTNKDVTLTVNAEDHLSGLNAKAYSFDNGATWQAENTKTYTENTNGIIIKVKDNIDNIATYKTINITKIVTPESISIKTNPTKTVYNINDTLNTEGLVLSINYNNGTTEEIKTGFTCTPTTLSTKGTQEITVKYMEKTTKFTVTVKEAELESDVYEIDNSYISKINPDTTIDEFKKNISDVSNIKICDNNGNELKNTDKVFTGMKILINNEEKYIVVVKGDTNGDSKADIKDILAINKHRLNKSKLENEFLSAGDVNKDGNVDIKDILQINKFRLGKITSL